jgi:protein-S-isoprenylcysteine O-methyltransferase Ste14
MHGHNLRVYYDAAWITFAIVWLAAAFTNKPTERSQDRTSRLSYLIVLLIGSLLLLHTPLHEGVLSRRFVPRSLLLGYIGLALTVAGVAFAIWARFIIGRNWSGRVTIKKDHELVRTGPYALVRHPIYTGVLCALAGTALGIGELHALLGLPLVFIGFVIKSRMEEKFMSEQFGEEYARYRQQVKALIPYVW